jgi:hypothetical protein
MVGTIGSIGNGVGLRGAAVNTTVGIYVAASGLGALVLGVPIAVLTATFAFVGDHEALRAWVEWAGVAMLGVLSLVDLGVIRLSLPTRRRQVPMSWKYLPGHWSPFVFGFALGTGFATTIYLASFYAFILVAIMTNSPFIPLIAALLFGLSRAVPVVLAVAVAPRLGTDRLIDTLATFRPVVQAFSGVVIAFAGGGVVFQLLR